MERIEFIDKMGTFQMEHPENYSSLYLPLASECGIKSSITPNFGGDCKTDQNHFLLEPVSAENLHNNRNTRNFWCRVSGKGYWSACGNSAAQECQKFTDKQEDCTLQAGFMWQKVTRTSREYELKSQITSFIPVDANLEVMLVEITNTSLKTQTITPVAAIPVYGRSADNLRDHRHVTSLLHRIRTTDYGVVTTPALSFDERGHQRNHTSYFVCGSGEGGEKPECFYPTVEEFIGEGGSFLIPQAVREEKPGKKAGTFLEGKEAMGGIEFAAKELKPREKATYIVLAGIGESKEQVERQSALYRTKKQVEDALEQAKKHWTGKVNVDFELDSKGTDSYLKWICFQPILRRIFGCSFLPYHDYGKGGRGWRDLWQDCLALLIMDPSNVRQMIVDNYGGVRLDGTNATIIGEKQGEFIADRNNIVRVWMDHGFWPFVTTKLYMEQTGDLAVLLEKVPYFMDRTVMDETTTEKKDQVCTGTILEHILLQNLRAFYDVGEHNEIRLHGADWNDAMDMAWERGESVAFTCAYAENLAEIAEYLDALKQREHISQVELAEEMVCLLTMDESDYDSISKKQELLKTYVNRCQNGLSAKTVSLSIEKISCNLKQKSQWMKQHIRQEEWVEDTKGNGWFNGYYDNSGRAVEGVIDGRVRMMLTSQVFAIMSGTATREQTVDICKSADAYLYEKEAGGYRLNTNFEEEKFDLGRMFGFAYGEKENGAVFSHMTVMYANALYKRGFVEEGYKAMQTLLQAAMDVENSRMYPGLPEYFNNQGRGLYSYLTGAASWYMLTIVTEVFGVRGDKGDLLVAPKLVRQQFNQQNQATIRLNFAGKTFLVSIHNPNKKTYGEYKIESAFLNGMHLDLKNPESIHIQKAQLDTLDAKKVQEILINLV